MSTRSQILVTRRNYDFANLSNRFDEPLIYRHSDGYPEGEHGVIAFLKPFCETFINIRGFDDSYLAARLIQHMCNKYDSSCSQHWEDLDTIQLLGHGIDNDIHGDIEYFYVVKPRTIEVYEPIRNSNYETTGFSLLQVIQYTLRCTECGLGFQGNGKLCPECLKN